MGTALASKLQDLTEEFKLSDCSWVVDIVLSFGYVVDFHRLDL
jgi:hypothetical protein